MSAQYNVCIEFIFYYFNIGYLFQGIDFAHSTTSLVYPIVIFFLSRIKMGWFFRSLDGYYSSLIK
jgi:hypothetical protein